MRDDSERRVGEWPTYVVLAACYGAFGLATFYWASLPLWLLPIIGGYLVALHGGLQHEMIHGHPTRSRAINELLVFPSLLLWVPYRRYRTLHLKHHDNARLTDPVEDPESFYINPRDWQRLPSVARGLLTACNTLAGRLIAGPAFNVAKFWHNDARRMLAGDSKLVADWLWHLPAAGLVLSWLVFACDMPLWVYVVCFVWPGTSLILLRSFAEHRAHLVPTARTIVVETNPALSLLYLNNNLHAAHHERPGLAWFRLPDYYRRHRDRLLAENSHYLLPGYRSLVSSYLLRPKEPVAHPLPATPSTPPHRGY